MAVNTNISTNLNTNLMRTDTATAAAKNSDKATNSAKNSDKTINAAKKEQIDAKIAELDKAKKAAEDKSNQNNNPLKDQNANGKTDGTSLPLEDGLTEYKSSSLSTSPTTTTNYTEQAYNDYLKNNQSSIDQINKSYADIEQYLKDANAAATDAAVLSYQNQLKAGKDSYEQQAAYQEYLKNVARDNAVLRNTANGNLGGIGNAQYSAEQAQYDSELLNIQLAITQLENDTASQIAQLQAEGRYNEAQQIADLRAQQLSDYVNQYNTIANMKASYANAIDSYNLSSQGQNFNQALSLIQMGGSNDQIASALGVTPEMAQKFANYYNTANQLGIKLSEAELQSALNSLASSGTTTTTTEEETTNEMGDMTLSQYNQYLAGLSDGSLEVFKGDTGESLGTTTVRGSGILSNTKVSDGDYIVLDGEKFYWNAANQDFEAVGDYANTQNQLAIDRVASKYETATGNKFQDATTAYNDLSNQTSKALKEMDAAEKTYYQAQLQWSNAAVTVNDSGIVSLYKDLADRAAQEYQNARAKYNQLAEARDALELYK